MNAEAKRFSKKRPYPRRPTYVLNTRDLDTSLARRIERLNLSNSSSAQDKDPNAMNFASFDDLDVPRLDLPEFKFTYETPQNEQANISLR